MRIAHVLSSFGLGGQERVALDLATRQVAAGHEVVVVALAPGPPGPVAAVLARRGIPALTVAKRPGVDVTLPVRLALLFLRRRVEVVHTHNPQPLVYAVPAARLVGARAVHTRHTGRPDRARRLALRRAAGRLVDAFVAVSSATGEAAVRDGEVTPARLHIIENGIDLACFHPDLAARAAVRATLAIPADAFVVCAIGRLAPEKAHAALIVALAPRLGERLRLLIAGDGPEAAALASRAGAGPAAGFIHLLGARSDVARLLAASDLFALPSLTEGLPLSLLEAMACALPVVATRVGGVPPVVEASRGGLVVPPDDPAALAAALGHLIDHPDEARAMGARGRVAALASYSDERMAREYLALYRG